MSLKQKDVDLGAQMEMNTTLRESLQSRGAQVADSSQVRGAVTRAFYATPVKCDAMHASALSRTGTRKFTHVYGIAESSTATVPHLVDSVYTSSLLLMHTMYHSFSR